MDGSGFELRASKFGGREGQTRHKIAHGGISARPINGSSSHIPPCINFATKRLRTVEPARHLVGISRIWAHGGRIVHAVKSVM